jgi:hypothetical protein
MNMGNADLFEQLLDGGEDGAGNSILMVATASAEILLDFC